MYCIYMFRNQIDSCLDISYFHMWSVKDISQSNYMYQWQFYSHNSNTVEPCERRRLPTDISIYAYIYTPLKIIIDGCLYISYIYVWSCKMHFTKAITNGNFTATIQIQWTMRTDKTIYILWCTCLNVLKSYLFSIDLIFRERPHGSLVTLSIQPVCR